MFRLQIGNLLFQFQCFHNDQVEEAKARSQARKQQEAEDRKKAVDHKTSAMGTSQSSFQVGGSMLF